MTDVDPADLTDPGLWSPDPAVAVPGSSAPSPAPTVGAVGAPVRRPAARARAVLSLVLLASLLVAAVVAGLLAARLINRPDTSSPAALTPASTDKETTVSVATTRHTSTTVERLFEPAFQVFPQRARAGSPLELTVRGVGCAGGSGVLSIVRIGSARDVGGLDRLVLRRRIDVDENGTWSTKPLLVNQPAGSYRLTASCERRATADSPQPVDDRRDLFSASEVLELTGPAGLDEFDVNPRYARPGESVTVRLSGRGACPPGGRVSGTLFANAGAAGLPRAFEAVVDRERGWTASLSLLASEAKGSYSVSATCSDGYAFITQQLRFIDPATLALPPREPLIPAAGQPGGPPTPIPSRPNYTG